MATRTQVAGYGAPSQSLPGTSSAARRGVLAQHRRAGATSIATATLAAIAAGAALLWLLGGLLHVLLLVFAGALVGLSLQGAGAALARRTRLPERACVAAVCLAIVSCFAIAASTAAPAVASQIDELSRTLPKSLSRAATALEQYDWGRTLVEAVRRPTDLIAPKETLSRVGGAMSTTLGALTSFIVIVFLALFIALDPGRYRRGLLRLVPPRKRERASEVMSKTAQTLRLWMAGKLAAMLVVGLFTWAGLSLLDIPLELTLALIAGLLAFIPYFGPVISAAPAILLGLLDGPDKALYVALLYVVIQTIESYLLTPLIEQKTVSLPPALGISSQLVMGTVAGALGVLVAAPLAAAALVVVTEVYVCGVLGEREA